MQLMELIFYMVQVSDSKVYLDPILISRKCSLEPQLLFTIVFVHISSVKK